MGLFQGKGVTVNPALVKYYASGAAIPYAGDFKEADHPRDGGKFTSKGGGDSGKSDDAAAKPSAKTPEIPAQTSAVKHIRDKAARLKARAEQTKDPDLMNDAKDYENIAAKLEQQTDPGWWESRGAWSGDQWLQAGQDLLDEEKAPIKMPQR